MSNLFYEEYLKSPPVSVSAAVAIIFTIKFLLGNDGLVSESVTESSQNWRKCQSIAQILSSCPLQAGSIEKYYSLVCPQVKQKLKSQFCIELLDTVSCWSSS